MAQKRHKLGDCNFLLLNLHSPMVHARVSHLFYPLQLPTTHWVGGEGWRGESFWMALCLSLSPPHLPPHLPAASPHQQEGVQGMEMAKSMELAPPEGGLHAVLSPQPLHEPPGSTRSFYRGGHKGSVMCQLCAQVHTATMTQHWTLLLVTGVARTELSLLRVFEEQTQPRKGTPD